MLEAETKRLCERDPPRLVRWRSVRHLEPHREFFATLDVMVKLKSTWLPITGEKIERASMRRSLAYTMIEHWIGGGPVFINSEIKPVGGWRRGIWELRVNSLRPFSRIFGFLPDKNSFLAVGLHNRDHLGTGNTAEWENAKNDAEMTWSSLYGKVAPLACPPEDLSNPERLEGYWDDK